MRVRRVKPYVCVDVDYAEHFRFQETKDVDAAAGTWLRCLAYSRAQERDGIVNANWVQRTFGTTFDRVEELVRVGLLVRREDGDYDLHAYAPRNQTRAMLEEERAAARERMAVAREAKATKRKRAKARAVGSKTPGNDTQTEPLVPQARARRERPNSRAKRVGSVRSASESLSFESIFDHRNENDVEVLDVPEVCSPEQAPNERRTIPNAFSRDAVRGPSSEVFAHAVEAPFAHPNAIHESVESAPPSSERLSFEPLLNERKMSNAERLPVREKCSPEQAANERRTIAFVPSSTSTSSSPSLSPSLGAGGDHDPDQDDLTGIVRGAAGGPASAPARGALPASERALWGALWLDAFTGGITDHTKRPCTAARMYLGTLERLISHHAPQRDAGRACAWIRAEAHAFAAKWDGKHPAKGLTPDGLERWLNDGRPAPPEFGRPRIVQPAAEDWHEDDWSDLGAEVMR